MLPASGGNLSGGCNSAGSSSYDLTSSGILLELNFFKVHFIGWSPTGQQPRADLAPAGDLQRARGRAEAEAVQHPLQPPRRAVAAGHPPGQPL